MTSDNFAIYELIIFGTIALAAIISFAQYRKTTRITRFFCILLIGMICSLIPFGPLSVIFGFPAVVLASSLVSILLDKENL